MGAATTRLHSDDIHRSNRTEQPGDADEVDLSAKDQSPEGKHKVATEDGQVELDVDVQTDPGTGTTSIQGSGTAQVGPDKKQVKVNVSVKVDEDGTTTAKIDIQGAKLTDQESDELLADVTREMAIDLRPQASIDRQAYEGMLSFSEGSASQVQTSPNSQGGQSISASSLMNPDFVSQDIDLDTEYEQESKEIRSEFRDSGRSARTYNGGGSGSSGSVDDGVISDAALNGLASSSDFQYRSQGNVEGNYFSKTAEGIMAEVSTADRRPGFWNGNRAEIAFNKKFRSSDNTGFRSFFDIHEGSNFSIFQLFNQVGKEGFPEAMVKVENGQLVLGGRAFGGKNMVLGALPEGKFGIDVKFSGGKVSIQLLDEAGQPVGEGFTAALTQPGGEFHYRAGPYFDGYNNKQFGSDMKNMTAKVEIIDPTMIG